MKLIEMVRPGSKSKIAMLPSGGLVVFEHTQEGSTKVKIHTAGVSFDVTDKYETVVENINAQIERWVG